MTWTAPGASARSKPCSAWFAASRRSEHWSARAIADSAGGKIQSAVIREGRQSGDVSSNSAGLAVPNAKLLIADEFVTLNRCGDTDASAHRCFRVIDTHDFALASHLDGLALGDLRRECEDEFERGSH